MLVVRNVCAVNVRQFKLERQEICVQQEQYVWRRSACVCARVARVLPYLVAVSPHNCHVQILDVLASESFLHCLGDHGLARGLQNHRQGAAHARKRKKSKKTTSTGPVQER